MQTYKYCHELLLSLTTDRQTNGRTDGHTHARAHGRTADERTDGFSHGRTDGQTDRTDMMYVYSSIQTISYLPRSYIYRMT